MRGVALHRFSNVSFRKLLRFSAKPTKFVIARRARAPDAAIFDGTICHPGTNYGCAERNRTINKGRGSRMKQRIHVFVIGISFCFVLPCFVPGCHTSNFKIATAALRPRNDTELERFYLENRRFSFMRSFFARYRSASSFKRSFRKSFRFQSFRSGNCSDFPQNPPDLSLRGGRSFCARRGNL